MKLSVRGAASRAAMLRTAAFASFFIVLALAGCSNAVKYTVSEQYGRTRPYTIAVMPVIREDAAEEGGAEVSRLFRTMSAERLKNMNYGVATLEDVDGKVLKQGANRSALKTPRETAAELGADAVLYIYITDWDTRLFVTYASLRFKARFELYSKDGAKLWQASHGWGDADLRLDRNSLELAVIKAYEPQVQRFVDLVFATLPPGEPPKDNERYFDWLP